MTMTPRDYSHVLSPLSKSASLFPAASTDLHLVSKTLNAEADARTPEGAAGVGLVFQARGENLPRSV